MVPDSVRSIRSSFVLRSSHFTSKECKWRSGTLVLGYQRETLGDQKETLGDKKNDLDDQRKDLNESKAKPNQLPAVI